MTDPLDKLRSVADLDDEIMISHKELIEIATTVSGMLDMANNPENRTVALFMSPSRALVIAALLATGLEAAIVEEPDESKR